jgi:hypothetical protein
MEKDIKRIYIVNLELTEEAKELTKQDYITTHVIAPYRLDICNILELAKKQYGQQNIKLISIKNTIYPDFEYLETIKENDIVAIRSLKDDSVYIQEVYRVSKRYDGKILIEFLLFNGCFLMDTGLKSNGEYSCYLDKPTEKEKQEYLLKIETRKKLEDLKDWIKNFNKEQIEILRKIHSIISL